ncbi:hypothetical protein [Gordonia aurantiaca]|uniref:hypothetical protein n=1 Tax=Gordonia sp. B21 TaxID=3151852 RepID=UPI003267705D
MTPRSPESGFTDTSATQTRPMTEEDREAALDLLESGLQEVPMYRWLLGEDAPSDAYRWYGELLFAENLAGLKGTFDAAGDLIALVAFSEPGRRSAPVSEELKAQNNHWVRALPGFPQRLTELRTKAADASVADEPLSIMFALVRPDHRRNGTLTALVDPIVRDGLRRGWVVVTTTADPVMSDYYARRWNAPVRARYTLTDGPSLFVHRADPPGTD